MTANPLELRGRHRVNNMNPEAALEADGWGNVMAEAYTGNSIGHRAARARLKVDLQMPREAFCSLKRRAAPGIDGVTYGEYAGNLDENLLRLVMRFKQGTSRARPVKRRWIAKTGSSKIRQNSPGGSRRAAGSSPSSASTFIGRRAGAIPRLGM